MSETKADDSSQRLQFRQHRGLTSLPQIAEQVAGWPVIGQVTNYYPLDCGQGPQPVKRGHSCMAHMVRWEGLPSGILYPRRGTVGPDGAGWTDNRFPLSGEELVDVRSSQMCSRGFVSYKGHFMGIRGSYSRTDTPRLRSPESLVCPLAAVSISIPCS